VAPTAEALRELRASDVARWGTEAEAEVPADCSRATGDGLTKSAWWLQHWDHHARIISDEQYGPFRACNSAGHLADNKGEPLILIPRTPPGDEKLI
jgi:hypothetical protein